MAFPHSLSNIGLLGPLQRPKLSRALPDRPYVPVYELSLGLGELGERAVDEDPAVLLVPLDGVKVTALGAVHHAGQADRLAVAGLDLLAQTQTWNVEKEEF